MTEWAEIARGYYLEALLIDGDAIWYTDVTQGGVRLVGSDRVLLPDRHMIGGLLRNQDGCLLVAGGDGIAWVDPVSEASAMLVTGLGGVNEMRSDGQGGILFGTIDLDGILAGKVPGPSRIYHLAQNRTLTLLKSGLTFANGLSVSADNNRLFFNESFSGVRGWSFDGPTALKDPLWAIDKPDCDGMAMDVEGNIWVSGFGSDHLLCLSPNGEGLCHLPVPGMACTNIRFGGDDLRDLYVTIVDPAGAQALAEGRMPDIQNSLLLKTCSPVAGAPMAPAAFDLG
jgi:sugar lactone lactonase YvrE